MHHHGCRPGYRCFASNPYIPNESLQALAEEYVEDVGFPPIQPTSNIKAIPEVAREMARIFENTPDQSNDPQVRKIWGQLVKEVKWQYDTLPFKIEPFYDDFVPYKDSEAMMRDVMHNNHLWVYDGGADHSLLTRKENFMLRAAHDAYGHCKNNRSFGKDGEEGAWVDHCKMFSPQARIGLTVETRFQNSWVNFGPYSNLPAAKRPYAEQKVFLPPLKYCTRPELQRAYADYPDFFPRVTAGNPWWK